MNDLQRIAPARALAVVVAVAAAAFGGLTYSGLAESLTSREEPAGPPQPAALPAVTVPEPAARPQGVQTVPAPDLPSIPGATPAKVRYKRCQLPGGRTLRVRRGTPCPRLPNVDRSVAERLGDRRAQTPVAPAAPAPATPAPASPAPGDGKGGAKFPSATTPR